MVRTRDFVLFLLILAFLVLAIFGTELWHSIRSTPILSSWWQQDQVEVDYSGEVPTVPDTRESRLATLRAKVAERLQIGKTAEEETPVEATTTEPTAVVVATTTSVTVTEVTTCAGYRVQNVPWVPQSVLQENREGVRVYFERGLPDPLASTTPENIRLVIPLRSWPSAKINCLPTDVIGVATDGSLMRNDELALYTVFGPSTVVGYSLDGFPIYGPSDTPTDSCGGATVGGFYRYILDAERPGLITCFAALPVGIN
jgi:hypothetical protein